MLVSRSNRPYPSRRAAAILGPAAAILVLSGAGVLARAQEGSPADPDLTKATVSAGLSTGAGAASGSAASAAVEPYTGPPIYLPVDEAPPAPSEVEVGQQNEKYPKTDIPRYDRRLIRFSDDSVLSDGPAKEYYSNGQLFAEGKYARGDMEGEWVYYHENGKEAKRVTYVGGLPEGEVKVFDAEGGLLAVREYSKGLRDGVWTYYAAGGDSPVREESYKSGKADGPWKTWYANGQLQQDSTFIDGKLEGSVTEYSSTGEKRAEARFEGGQRQGKTTIWRPDGSVIEREFDKGAVVESR